MTQNEVALIIGSLGNMSAPEAALLISLGNEAKEKKFGEIMIRVNNGTIVGGSVTRYLDKEKIRRLNLATTPDDVKA